MIENTMLGRTALVRVTVGQIDVSNVDRFLSAISNIAKSLHTGSRFVLDLQAVEVLAAQGINVLVAIQKQLQHGGSELRLLGVREDVYTKLQMLKLTSLLNVDGVIFRSPNDMCQHETEGCMPLSRNGGSP